MKKKFDTTLTATTLICLVPIVLSLVLYDKLPGQIAIHWDSAGNPDNFVSRPVAVFGLPVLLAVINIIVHFSINNDPKKANASKQLKILGKWAVPAIALIAQPITLFIAMGIDIPIQIIVPALVGLLIVICGNYLPKCKQNYTVGIKLPWTLNDEDNWNRTHRFAGYVFITGGILMIINVFLNVWFATAVLIVLLAVAPVVYSYALYKKTLQNIKPN